MVWLLSSLPLLLLVGCSSKQSFEPKTVANSSHIELKDREAVEEQSRLNYTDGQISFNGERIDLQSRVVSASERDGEIAFLLSNGDIGVYSVDENRTLFREKIDSADAIDRRIPKPLIEDRSIIFFSLGGKVAVYNREIQQLSREFQVGLSGDFKNIIGYSSKKEYMIFVTHNGLTRLAETGKTDYQSDTRGAIFDSDKRVFLIGKDGSITALSTELEELSSVKFPFAYFTAWGMVDNRIYLIEKEGYVIEIDSDLETHNVFDIGIDRKCSFSEDRFICDNKILNLPL
jgi:hypothetical protein